NGVSDIFRHDRVTGETIRVSVNGVGNQVRGASQEPQISADGSVVAFTSSAFELVPEDANGVADVFVRDIGNSQTSRVSLGVVGRHADQASGHPSMSGDGRYVAFSSTATNMVGNDANGVSDVFVHDRAFGTSARVSVSSTGAEGNASSDAPFISQDGRFV